MTIQKAYKYRIYPNEVTAEKLQWVLDRCRELYNAGLQERRDAYEMLVKRHPEYYNEETRKELSRTHRITYEDQANMLPKIKQIRKEYREIGSHVLQETLKRLDKAFQHFFRRVKNGEVPGYPRFQGKNRYDSFTYPDGAGWKIETVKEPNEKKGGGRGKLKLTKIGEIRVVLHRKMQGTIKTVTIKREADQWYVVFSCEVEKPIPLPVSYENVGIDLGVTHFAALSDGTFIESPRYYRKADKNLKKLQQTLSKKKRGSHRRAKAVKAVARAHRRVRNQRRDFAHKASRTLVNQYQIIAFENLKTANLTKRPKPKQDEKTGAYLPNGASAKAGLNKSILDAGWRMFTQMVSVKAAWAGRTIVFVNPSKTSQICPNCGTIRKKTLDERWHSCDCGCELDRDTASAKVILDLGHQQLWSGRGQRGQLRRNLQSLIGGTYTIAQRGK